MPRYRFTLWTQRHRTLTALIARTRIGRDWLSRKVWEEAESDPAFVAAIEQGRADLAAGRFVAYEPGDWDARAVKWGIVDAFLEVGSDDPPVTRA